MIKLALLFFFITAIGANTNGDIPVNDATPDPVLKIRCPGLSKPIDTRD